MHSKAKTMGRTKGGSKLQHRVLLYPTPPSQPLSFNPDTLLILQRLPIARQFDTVPRHSIHAHTQILNPQLLLLINPLPPLNINANLLLSLLQSTRLDILSLIKRLLLLTTLDEVVYDLSDETLVRFVDDDRSRSRVSSSTRSATATGGLAGCSAMSAHFGI